VIITMLVPKNNRVRLGAVKKTIEQLEERRDAS